MLVPCPASRWTAAGTGEAALGAARGAPGTCSRGCWDGGGVHRASLRCRRAREAGGGGVAAVAAAAQPLLSSHSLAAPARGPRRHGRGSRVAAAAGRGPQQGEGSPADPPSSSGVLRDADGAREPRAHPVVPPGRAVTLGQSLLLFFCRQGFVRLFNFLTAKVITCASILGRSGRGREIYEPPFGLQCPSTGAGWGSDLVGRFHQVR